MEGPAENRLRKHLKFARDYINLYKDNKRFEDLEVAEYHLHVSVMYYKVIYETNI